MNAGTVQIRQIRWQYFILTVTAPRVASSFWRSWEWVGLWHGRKFLNARNYCLPPLSPIFLCSHSCRALQGSVKGGFWTWTGHQDSTFTPLPLSRPKTFICLPVTREVSSRTGPVRQCSASAPAFGPRHNFPFIHEERYGWKLLSLSPLIMYCMTAEITFFSFQLVSALSFQLRIHLCSHSQSEPLVTCWQYSQHRGGILNDSLKWEIMLAEIAGILFGTKITLSVWCMVLSRQNVSWWAIFYTCTSHVMLC